MNVHALALAFALAVAAVPQDPPAEKPPTYRFLKDEIQKYEVAGDLKLSLKGSHADFIEKGNDLPLKVEYRVLFENVVMALPADGLPARLERRVVTLKASGEFKGEAFKVEYDREKPEGKRFAADEGHADMAGFFRSWCLESFKYTVDGDGKIAVEPRDFNRLMVKAGAMYWPVKADDLKWVSRERIAVPLLHHKIDLDMQNAFGKTESQGGRKFMIIDVKPQVAGSEPPPPEFAGVVQEDVKFTASGDGKVEIDLTNGRLHSTKLNLKILVNGKGQVSDGSTGDFKGEATFVETQTYKDK